MLNYEKWNLKIKFCRNKFSYGSQTKQFRLKIGFYFTILNFGILKIQAHLNHKIQDSLKSLGSPLENLPILHFHEYLCFEYKLAHLKKCRSSNRLSVDGNCPRNLAPRVLEVQIWNYKIPRLTTIWGPPGESFSKNKTWDFCETFHVSFTCSKSKLTKYDSLKIFHISKNLVIQ